MLVENVANKTFREDLYYRLNVIHLRVPPLRERTEDVPMLLNHFIEKFARQYGSSRPRSSAEALETLVEHAWPGNVRELKNIIERIVIRNQSGEMERDDLPLEVLRPFPAAAWGRHRRRRLAPRVGDVVQADGHRRQSFWSSSMRR